MSKAIAILLFIALSFQLVAKLGIVALYEANKDYIAQNLCENRAKPKMHCNGKCYLKKQLKKASDTENDKSSNSSSKSEVLQLVVFLIPFLKHPDFSNSEEIALRHYSSYLSITGISALKDIFHPPQQIC